MSGHTSVCEKFPAGIVNGGQRHENEWRGTAISDKKKDSQNDSLFTYSGNDCIGKELVQ